MIRLIRLVLLLAVCAGLSCTAQARPDLTQPQEGQAELDTSFYWFTQLDLESEDTSRRYRVWIGVPKGAAPAEGYPALYMLDGNGALECLDDELLSQVDTGSLPVLVLLGYPVTSRFDVVARAYDYTPPIPPDRARSDVDGRQRPGGGADSFADFIERQVKPAVSARVKVNPARQTLWGHSYGGLFALHLLFTRPQAFQAYAVADPSLWWQQGFVLSEQHRFTTARPLHLLMMRGVAPAQGKGPSGARDFPAGAARDLASLMATLPHMTVEYREFALGHGAMFKASLLPTLRFATDFSRQDGIGDHAVRMPRKVQ